MNALRLASAAALALALGAAPARAFGSKDAGTSGAAFLKLGPGARPAGMGEAFGAVADDVHAVYYNPAGLGSLRRVEAAGMHQAHFEGIDYEFAALSVPLMAWGSAPERDRAARGVLAVAVYSLSVDDIERRGLVETDGPTDTFGSSDFAYALSYGYAVPDTGLSLGLTGKVVDSRLDSAGATSFAADAGVLWRRGGRLGFGAGLRNAGTKHTLGSQGDPLPLVGFVGAAAKLQERTIVSAEVDVPRDDDVGGAVGVEYARPFGDRLSGSLRGGYNTARRDAGGLAGMSFGAGVTYAQVSFDFAFVPFGDLGNAFKYSFVVKF